MDKKKLKKINKLLYFFSFCFLVLSSVILFAANRFIVLQEDVFYSIGLFFVFLLLICMAIICFLNGIYEIRNPDWFLTPFGYQSEASFGYQSEASLGWPHIGDSKSKIIFKIFAMSKLIIGVGIFVFAVFFFVFAVSLLLG